MTMKCCTVFSMAVFGLRTAIALSACASRPLVSSWSAPDAVQGMPMCTPLTQANPDEAKVRVVIEQAGVVGPYQLTVAA